MKKLFLISALLLFASPVSAQNITIRPSQNSGVVSYNVHFTSSSEVNTISDAITSCLTMTVFFDQGAVGAVSLYETDLDDVTFAAVEASTLIKAFTGTAKHGPFSPTKSSVRFVVDTKETGAPSKARVECSNVSSGMVSILIGGEGSPLIADTANPNDTDNDKVFDDPIICAERCFFQTSATYGGGWWAAVTTDGTSTTEWSALQEQLLFSFQLEGKAAYNTDAYSSTDCLWTQNVEVSSLVVCSDENAKTSWSRDVFITSWSWIGRGFDGTANSQTTSSGCVAKLVTGLSGGTDITGAEIKVPPTSAVIAHGEVFTDVVGQTISAGDNLQFKVRDGDFCEDGTGTTTCACDATWGYSQVEIWGIIQ